jgi:hypothetical protein
MVSTVCASSRILSDSDMNEFQYFMKLNDVSGQVEKSTSKVLEHPELYTARQTNSIHIKNLRAFDNVLCPTPTLNNYYIKQVCDSIVKKTRLHFRLMDKYDSMLSFDITPASYRLSLEYCLKEYPKAVDKYTYSCNISKVKQSNIK